MIISDAKIVSHRLSMYDKNRTKFSALTSNNQQRIIWSPQINNKYNVPRTSGGAHKYGIIELKSKTLILYEYDNVYTIIKITQPNNI